MDAKLVVVSGDAQSSEYALTLPAIVGRSRAADIKLGHALVSRKHAEIFESDGQLVVRDLGSLNGTFIGDTRISDATVLPPGGMVTIGAVTFQAVYGDMTEEAADSDTSELLDFMSPPATSRRTISTPIEQTLEMSESDAVPDATAAAGRDGGIDFGWLEEPAEEEEKPQPKAAPKAKQPGAKVVASAPQAAEEEELSFPDPADVSANGAAGGDADEFAPPAKQAAAGGDDDDLSDFFASLKD